MATPGSWPGIEEPTTTVIGGGYGRLDDDSDDDSDDSQRKRREFEQKYRQALLGARAKCSYGRIMFLGAAAVGKTSLRHGLMNKRLPRKANSTILAKTRPVKYAWAMTGNPANHQWAKVTEDDEIAEEVQMVKNVTPAEFLLMESTTRMHSGSEPIMSQVNYTAKLTEVEKHKEKVLDQASAEFLDQASADEQSQSKANQEVLLHLWDCGGQPVFLDVLPAFLSSRTMFLLVFNASIGLEAPFRVYAFDDGRRNDQGMSVITTLSLFHKWMAMIHARFGGAQQQGRLPCYPRILLVGTHADQIASGATRKKKIIQKKKIVKVFHESIKGKQYGDMVLGTVILNNTTAGTDKADFGFKEIQEIVYSFVHDKLTIETPVSWIHFRKVLQLHTKKLKKVISLDEVYNIAAECHVPHDEIRSALLFYHELGVFLFYPVVKGLKSVVILEPQWLVDQFGKLFASWKGKTEFSDMWNTLTHYGILVEPLYEDVLGNVCEHNLTPAALIEMLEHFLLAAPIVTTGLHTRSGKVKEYFIPHMLQHHLSQPPLATTSKSGKRKSFFSLRPSTSCDAEMQSYPPKNAAPIHLTFLSGYVPPGYYVRLATSLASKEGVMVLFHPIYRDQITMDIGVDRLTITEHIDTVELQYSRRAAANEPFRESCRKLLLLLDECFSEVHQWLPGARPQLAFPCLECARVAQPDIPSREKFCSLELVGQHLRCQIRGHISLPTHDQVYWLYKMNAIECDQAQFEKRLQLAKSTSPNVAFELADQLEVNPLTAVIHQYRRIGGDDDVLVKALSYMKLTAQLDTADQLPVLDVESKSSSAASQASSSQIPVPDTSMSTVRSTSSVCTSKQTLSATSTVSPTPGIPAHTGTDNASVLSTSSVTTSEQTALTSTVSSIPKISSTPAHIGTEGGYMAQPIHSALQAPPDLLNLLDKVAAKTRAKWELVAVQLGITSDCIRSIHTVKQAQPIHCYREIFDMWKNKGSPPYTWATIIKALRAPSVGEGRLANELQEWLLTTQLDTADQLPVLDVESKSSSAASQASSSQIPVPDTPITTVCSTSSVCTSKQTAASTVSSTPEISPTPAHTGTDSGHMAQPIHSALQAPPDLLGLLNKVAAEATDKWEQVAEQLGIKPSRIHSIHAVKQGRPIPCYTEIFDLWESKGSPPYTWATIINALRAPAVGEERLANKLLKWLLTQ